MDRGRETGFSHSKIKKYTSPVDELDVECRKRVLLRMISKFLPHQSAAGGVLEEEV